MTEAMMTDKLLNEQFSNLVQQTLQHEDEDESAKKQDFLQINNVVEKKGNYKTVHYSKN